VPGRRLDPEEQALWDRVAATVRPLVPARTAAAAAARPAPFQPMQKPRPAAHPAVLRPAAPVRPQGATLDGGWDRALRRGAVVPEMVIDLHGHSLAAAHAALDAGIDRALGQGSRVVLLVTGRAPREGGRRGIIHASFRDWLTASRHARRIAAVRPAHPRHGGNGAFYLVLRRDRRSTS
jgi:DNA-nicking Smr family endonuclease